MSAKLATLNRYSWFKFNKLELTIGMALQFDTSVAKGLKVKVRKNLELILKFLEVTGKNQWGKGLFGRPILNRVNTTDDPYAPNKVKCVPNKVKNMNVKVFNLMSRVSET